ncbi:hypothetical protein ACYB68_27535 [Klebsiella pneumoniae]|uniref:hypothetical protein n=1 Tax=Klebsiella pneumoniae complex TaxID=3390273 RepID=UPI001F43DEFA|nr:MULTISPECIES: hypothetical protein [Klebsiella]MCS4427255.1 hypothetical protein [Klebsiella quasipneumoniae subsp. similipneumoniae]
MSERSKRAGKRNQSERRLELIKALWGSEVVKTWHRLENDGYSTVPRYLPLIGVILDGLSKGAPLSSTYLALWFRVSDEGLIEVRDKTVLAYESGFASDRGVTTWSGRMRKLKELGFISTREGSTGEFHNVLIVHPLVAVKKLLEDGIITKGRTYNILVERTVEIKASWGE